MHPRKTESLERGQNASALYETNLWRNESESPGRPKKKSCGVLNWERICKTTPGVVDDKEYVNSFQIVENEANDGPKLSRGQKRVVRAGRDLSRKRYLFESIVPRAQLLGR